MTTAFTSEECDLFARVLSAAWDHLADTGQGEDEALVKAALGRAILEGAELGERREQLLVAYALAHLEQAKAALRAPGRPPKLRLVAAT